MRKAKLTPEEKKERIRLRYKRWFNSPAGKAYMERSKARKNETDGNFRQTEKGKKMQRETAKRMREKYPEKWIARNKLKYEVRMGRIKRLPCEVCGTEKVEAHHEDYSKPYEVAWLCTVHHRELHKNQALGSSATLIEQNHE